MTSKAKRRATYAVLTVAVLATPFISYELVRAVTGDGETASRAFRRTWDGITNAAQMWLVLELFFTVKMRRLSSLLRKPADE